MVYKLAGGNFIIDFSITLNPNPSGDINIYHDVTEGTSEVIEHIAAGINDYLTQLKVHGIALAGVDFIIQNAVVHPVDYRSDRYRQYTARKISSIFYEKGIKTCYKPSGIKNHANFKFENRDSRYAGYNFHNIYPDHKISNSTELPRVNKTIVALPEGIIFTQELHINGTNEEVTVIVAGTKNSRNQRYAELYTKQETEFLNAFILINNALQKFITDVYAKNMELEGFVVYIVKSNIVYKRENVFDLKDKFYWFLKALFIEYNTVQEL